MKKTILYCILDWGLGHATRSIPIIRALLEKDHAVVLVSTGRSLMLLRDEFPRCDWVDLPDYGIRYSRNAWTLIPYLLLQTPAIFVRLWREHRFTERLVVRHCADAVISDNRYGCYSNRAPSYYMTHQLRFQMPRGLGWSAFISEWFNRFFFRHFDRVLIPDEKGTPNLSGALSHSGRISTHPKLCYVGPLSSLAPHPASHKTVDYLFLVSGPEPQRTLFEEIVLGQIRQIPGKKVVVLGKPESSNNFPESSDRDLEIHAHLNRKEMADVMRRSRWIVSRSGYSTLMELAAFGKKALLVPTPGQTEQEYLARFHRRDGLFFCASQSGLSLKKSLDEAERFYSRSRPAISANRVTDILRLLEISS